MKKENIGCAIYIIGVIALWVVAIAFTVFKWKTIINEGMKAWLQKPGVLAYTIVAVVLLVIILIYSIVSWIKDKKKE